MMVLEERKERKKSCTLAKGEIFIKILLTNAINSYVERKMAPLPLSPLVHCYSFGFSNFHQMNP